MTASASGPDRPLNARRLPRTFAKSSSGNEGTGLTGATSVTFNGVKADTFKVVSDTYMTAVVPAGASSGKVVVTTPSQSLTSNVNFRISQ